jgi:hypothetical protein
VLSQLVPRRYEVDLAAFLPEMNPPLVAVSVIVADLDGVSLLTPITSLEIAGATFPAQ